MSAMQTTRISDVVCRKWIGGGIAAAVVLGSVAVASPAHALEFSARVGAIAHNAGDVTLTGTGDAGDLVSITPSDGEPLDTRVRPDGSWRAKAHVDGFGDHTFRVSDSEGSARTLQASTHQVSFRSFQLTHDDAKRFLQLTGLGFEPRARIEMLLDGAPIGTTTADRDGTFAHRISDVAFGKHTVTTIERFDGAEQLRLNTRTEISGDPEFEDVRVDPIGRTVHVEGRGPAGTEMRFVDASGAPWSLTDGQDWTTNTDGTWSADLVYPSAGTRFMGIVAEVYSGDTLVGSATSGATIPFPVTAAVSKYTPKQLVLTGSAEPGARLSFTDADGAPITDADGNRVEPPVPGSSTWTVTLDPRRFTGSTVTVSAADGPDPLGSATVAFR